MKHSFVIWYYHPRYASIIVNVLELKQVEWQAAADGTPACGH